MHIISTLLFSHTVAWITLGQSSKNDQNTNT